MIKTKKIILLFLLCVFLFQLSISPSIGQESDQKTIKFKFITPPPSETTPTPTNIPTPTVSPTSTPTLTLAITLTLTITPTPALSTQCGYQIAAAARDIVNSWPVGTVWNGLSMCTESCSDEYGYRIPEIKCEQTLASGKDIYFGSCKGMVCTDLVRAAYDTAGCYLPTDADSRAVNVMIRAFKENSLLRYYGNGDLLHPLEPGDVIFFGKTDGTWFSHVGIVSEVRPNGFYMQNMNARRVYFIARIGDSGNLYDSPIYSDRHILLGWGRAAQ